ncbi:MAG: hypothetical protein WC325_04610 [Candidatus Bathyarchaeia archaeon]|jgi:hypothetical protein
MSLIPSFIYKSDFSKYLGTSDQAKYLIDYLNTINAETCICEKYIDKDYLVDFQKFYCRSFKPYPRFTDRFHFFQEKIDETKFSELVEKNDINGLKKLFASYLGFIIKKPVSDEFGNELIGRTMLQTYPKKDQYGNDRCFIVNENEVCLFGVPLKIKSVPFQMQDQRVSACATISLWTTLHALSELFDIPKSSPSEITEISTSFISKYRNFPQGGLTIGQMLKCIRSMGD